MPSTSSEQMQALTSANAALQADNAQLAGAITDIRAANGLLEQRIRILQVAVTILLASSAASIVGMATSMSGAGVQTALASASGVFFAVIMASMAILAFLRR